MRVSPDIVDVSPASKVPRIGSVAGTEKNTPRNGNHDGDGDNNALDPLLK